MELDHPFLPVVEAFLARHGMSATTFGWNAANDPRLVHMMRRNGRKVQAPLRERLERFMAGFDDKARGDAA